MTTSSMCWKNGAITAQRAAGPALASMSLHMGLAVFDGIMAYPRPDGRHSLHAGEAHLARMLVGADNMGFPCPYSVEELIAGARAVLATRPADQPHYIRPIVFRGADHLWLTDIEAVPIDTAIIAMPAQVGKASPMRLCIVPVERVRSAAIPVAWKISGTYVNSYLSRSAAVAEGYDDGIMLDSEGRLTEASAANLFLVLDGRLVTPPARDCVFPGITRKQVIAHAHAHGIAVEERDVCPDELAGAEALFIASTLLELRPVVRVGHYTYDSTDNPVFRTILAAFRRDTLSQPKEATCATVI